MVLLLFPIWMPFLYFPYLIVLSRTDGTMLNKRGHPCIIGDLTEKAFNFSSRSIMLTVGLLYTVFIMLWYFPYILTVFSFSLKWHTKYIVTCWTISFDKNKHLKTGGATPLSVNQKETHIGAGRKGWDIISQTLPWNSDPQLAENWKPGASHWAAKDSYPTSGNLTFNTTIWETSKASIINDQWGLSPRDYGELRNSS